jgi:hypothetical protein
MPRDGACNPDWLWLLAKSAKIKVSKIKACHRKVMHISSPAVEQNHHISSQAISS